ncbi:hypothetical protein HQ447_19095 [bacterium]|nr:hypothetical protein [bacterium]
MQSKTIKTTLICDLTDKERREYGISLATTLGDMEDVEGQKKKEMDHYKDRLSGMQARADELSRKVRDGKEWRDVECRVYYGQPDKEHKQTIRMDTGETVKTERMTETDLQLVMPLDETQDVATQDTSEEEDEVLYRDAEDEFQDQRPPLEYVDLMQSLGASKGAAKRTALIEEFITEFGETALAGVLELAKSLGFDEKKTEHLATFVREADPTGDY